MCKGRFITSKKDKFYHGIGIESIKPSINKYGGDIRIKEEEEKFVVSIYLPIYESWYKKGVLKPEVTTSLLFLYYFIVFCYYWSYFVFFTV